MPDSPGGFLRRLATLLVRGPDAPFVLGDLEEAMHRDVERGMPPRRARWRYLVNALGSGLSLARARLSSRSPGRIGTSWLDVKLAIRMLGKHPGLSAVAIFALALGIPTSLAPIHMLRTMDAVLPFEGGDEILGLRYYYVAESYDAPGSLHDYTVWRDRLGSFERIGAASQERYNVVAEDGRTRPYRGSRMSASAFTIAGVPPLLGRPLLESDEVVGAPDVVVLAYDVWQTVLHGDPDVLGRTVKVGGVPHTVVGVMPQGFYFPDYEYLWLPLRAGALANQPASGPATLIFGRLADGVSEAQAMAEMMSVHAGLAEAHPHVYDRLRPQIVPYTYLVTGNPLDLWMAVGLMQLFALVLLAVACGNVGTLILARTAARSGEIAVRTALGASRARIVSQLFVESLVLALVSTGIGLSIAVFVADRMGRLHTAEGDMPFWMNPGRVDFRLVLMALGLAVFCAVIAGVVPALKATGREIQSNMQRLGSARAGVRFGHATTALIVAEVALGVVCLFAGVIAYRIMQMTAPGEIAIDSEDFLTAELRLPNHAFPSRDDSAGVEVLNARLAMIQREIARRLSAEQGVRGVAFATNLPGEGHGEGRLEVDGIDQPEDEGQRVLRNFVDVGFFSGLGQGVLHGRDFAASDLPARPDDLARAVIVNTAFVERVLRGRNAIGQRVRYATPAGEEPGPWFEIIGVVGQLGMVDYMNFNGMVDDAGMYHPVHPGAALLPTRVAIHLSSDPVAFVPRLHEIAAEVDPEAIVLRPMRMDLLEEEDRKFAQWVVFGLVVVAGIAVVLSIAGLYALMSFTVAQRRQEIGVRSALGAQSRSIVVLIAKRAVVQLAIGVALGVVVVSTLVRQGVPDTALTPLSGWPLVAVAAGVAIVLIGAIASMAPIRRGLGIRPIEALRAD